MNRCLQGLKLEVDYAILDKWDERNERGRNKTRGKMEKIDADWSMWETFPNRHVHVVCVTVLLTTEQREEKTGSTFVTQSNRDVILFTLNNF